MDDVPFDALEAQLDERGFTYEVVSNRMQGYAIQVWLNPRDKGKPGVLPSLVINSRALPESARPWTKKKTVYMGGHVAEFFVDANVLPTPAFEARFGLQQNARFAERFPQNRPRAERQPPAVRPPKPLPPPPVVGEHANEPRPPVSSDPPLKPLPQPPPPVGEHHLEPPPHRPPIEPPPRKPKFPEKRPPKPPGEHHG